MQQPEPLPIQVAFRRPETLSSGPMDEVGAMAPVLANGHAPYSRTLSHISEASVDAALAEASVEAGGSESLTLGLSSPVHPDPTQECPNCVPSVPDTGHSATSPGFSTTSPVSTSIDPVPSACQGSVHKATDSSPSKLPSPTDTTINSTCSAINPINSAPSSKSTTTGSTHNPLLSTLTPTGSITNTTGPAQTMAGWNHTTSSPTHTTTSSTHTIISPTHTTTSPFHKARMSTHTTTSPTPNAMGPAVQTTHSTFTTVNPSTSGDIAILPTLSTDTTLPGTNPSPCSHSASTPCIRANPTAPNTYYPGPVCFGWKPLTSPAPDPPEPILQSLSSPPSPLTPVPQHSELSLATATQAPVPGAIGGTGDRKLEEALGALMAALDDYRGQFPELQGLEQEVTRLESLLLVRIGLGWAGVA